MSLSYDIHSQITNFLDPEKKMCRPIDLVYGCVLSTVLLKRIIIIIIVRFTVTVFDTIDE